MRADVQALARVLWAGYLQAGLPITAGLIEQFTSRLLCRLIIARCARAGTFQSN